jgi:hypothetical protein
VWQHYHRGSFAIISAYRSDSSEEVNEARAKAMKHATRRLGYGYVEIEGHWIEQKGPRAGEDLVEYPLFIPAITFEDAVYLGSGDYYDGEAQWSVIYADDESIYEVRPDAASPQIVSEYPKLETNFQKSWDVYSRYKGKDWRYIAAKVTWKMLEPPPAEPKGYAQARAKAAWRDDAPHDFFHRRKRAAQPE